MKTEMTELHAQCFY